MAEKFFIGTCGYDYPEWRGIFYPADLKRKDFLTWYAEQFDVLEIDFTFYHMPSEQQLRLMYQRSGEKLMFSVKVPGILTHDISADWDKDVKIFRNALQPFRDGGVLSSILLQFPQSFHYTIDNRIYLDKLLQAFSGDPCAVEFRHTEWMTERVYAGLDKRGAALCLTDAPLLKALPQLTPVLTGGMGYIRFHGRNARNWYNSTGINGSSRYAYLYNDQELKKALSIIKKLASAANKVQVFFNNHPDGDAVKNAKTMKKLLGETV